MLSCPLGGIVLGTPSVKRRIPLFLELGEHSLRISSDAVLQSQIDELDLDYVSDNDFVVEFESEKFS